jgi:hypothetical protein
MAVFAHCQGAPWLDHDVWEMRFHLPLIAVAVEIGRVLA